MTIVFVVWLAIYGVEFALTVLAFPDRWQHVLTVPYLIAAFVVGCFFFLPFDRFYEERFRRLEPISDDTNVA